MDYEASPQYGSLRVHGDRTLFLDPFKCGDRTQTTDAVPLTLSVRGPNLDVYRCQILKELNISDGRGPMT